MIKISVGVVKKSGESVAIAYCLNFENDTFPSFSLVSEGFSHTLKDRVEQILKTAKINIKINSKQRQADLNI